jgi:methionyl-tRNA synthetase
LKAYPAVISSSEERLPFREALGELMNARLGNKYLADEEPWKMIKRMKVVYKHKCMLPCKLQLLSALASLSYLYSDELSRILK